MVKPDPGAIPDVQDWWGQPSWSICVEVEAMANVDDVAAYILNRQGPMTAMKLQKLCYYSQAWHLVWDSEPLFGSRIEAWANGPVVVDLYRKHRGQFTVTDWPSGDPARLQPNEVESIDVVLGTYGSMSAYDLSAQTHREAPWKDARQGLAPGDRCSREITDSAMAEYYEGLVA